MRIIIILLIIIILISFGIFINGIRNSKRRTIHNVMEDNEHDNELRKRANRRKKVTIIEEMPDNNDNTVE
jgi:hypothetical protein